MSLSYQDIDTVVNVYYKCMGSKCCQTKT